MARTDTLRHFLTDIANSIRNKKGTTDPIMASDFDTEIASIESGVDINDYYLTSATSRSNINIKHYIKQIPLIEAPNATNLYGFFDGCIALTTIPLIDTSAATNMNSMFRDCKNLISIPQLDTSKVVYMSSMFNNCVSLTTIPPIDTSNVTDMNNMFNGCTKLISIPPIDTSKVVYMSNMFYNCTSLTTIPPIDTSNVTAMNNMFAYCNLLTTIPQLDLSKVTDVSQMFFACYPLTTLGGFQNLGMAYDTSKSANYRNYRLDLSNSTKLTHDSLMNVINNLYDIATKGCNAQQLILGSINLAKLTAEEIAIATDKGWTVS